MEFDGRHASYIFIVVYDDKIDDFYEQAIWNAVDCYFIPSTSMEDMVSIAGPAWVGPPSGK